MSQLAGPAKALLVSALALNTKHVALLDKGTAWRDASINRSSGYDNKLRNTWGTGVATMIISWHLLAVRRGRPAAARQALIEEVVQLSFVTGWSRCVSTVCRVPDQVTKRYMSYLAGKETGLNRNKWI
eukprot:1571629-Amphidinium_carterae.1